MCFIKTSNVNVKCLQYYMRHEISMPYVLIHVMSKEKKMIFHNLKTRQSDRRKVLVGMVGGAKKIGQWHF